MPPRAAVATVVLFFALTSSVSAAEAPENHEYCVVGAGPAGLQMAHFLKEAGRDFVLFERSNVSGSFYVKFPRHRTLISINKRFTGSSNKEFNLRHDWNSLISHTSDIAFTQYSKDYFPAADRYLEYLEDFRRVHGIEVRYDTNLRNLQTTGNGDCRFSAEDQRNTPYCCQNVLMATGIDQPVIPPVKGGAEHMMAYETMSVEPEDYAGKSVLILGRGNSGMETAKGLYGAANYVHLVARSRRCLSTQVLGFEVKFSWETHYVGDIRGVNNEVLDAYMLKSLDGVFEAGADEIAIKKRADGKLLLVAEDLDTINFDDSNPTRDAYDVVIRCTGFKWSPSLFANGSGPSHSVIDGIEHQKYPRMGADFESEEFPHLYFLGTLTHALDWRKSAGGFIHGFRYNARVLHRLLEWRHHLRPWPSAAKPNHQLLPSLMKRANEASGIYQMFQFLADVLILDHKKAQFTYLEEFPIKLIPRLEEMTGHAFDADRHHLLVMSLEYGANFSKAGEDHFGDGRANVNPEDAHLCNFLHPVFRFYRSLPTQESFDRKEMSETMPRSDGLHHTIEDFTTYFDGPTSHLFPLRRFLEFILDEDLRVFTGETCMARVLTGGLEGLPPACLRYLQRTPSVSAFAI